MPKNWKGGPFGVFKHQICCKRSKKLKGDFLERKKIEKKSHNAEKLKGGTLWGFSTSILSQNIKKLKWEKFLFSGKNLSAEINWKGDPLRFSNIHSDAKQQKIEGGPFGGKFRKKVSQCRKNERGTLWGFSTSILSQNSKKLKGDPLEKKFSEKKVAVPKKIEMEDPLVSPGMVCYAEKQEKPFWFSSLGQIVQ